MRNYYVFDNDGTLVDSMDKWSSKLTELLDAYKVKYPVNFIETVTPMGTDRLIEYLINDLDFKRYTPDELKAIMTKTVLEMYKSDVDIKPYVKEYLEKLKKEGKKLYVFTAGTAEMAKAALERNGVAKLFDGIYSSDEFGKAKSESGIYPLLAEKIGADIEDIVFFDDNAEAVAAAKEAGFYTVGVYDSHSYKIRETADEYITSFKEKL